MRHIKALPSTYNGVVFRSRLEARWASLFDRYLVEWVYEAEGFETPSGNYLPDFFFPELRCYVEVKPAPGLFNEIAVRSVAEQTACGILILDSPIVECRAYPLLSRFDEGLAWTDMSWCFSAKYLISRRNDENRFFACVGVEHEETQSGECWCKGRPSDQGLFAAAKNLRFNNGVAA